MKSRYAILSLVVLLVQSVHAQYDPSFAHYFDMETSFNAAAVGKESMLNINAAYNMSLAGFEHNPNTVYASADMPFYFMKMYHGVACR